MEWAFLLLVILVSAPFVWAVLQIESAILDRIDSGVREVSKSKENQLLREYNADLRARNAFYQTFYNALGRVTE